MRVLWVCGRMPPERGGLQRYIFQLLRHLGALERVDVVTACSTDYVPNTVRRRAVLPGLRAARSEDTFLSTGESLRALVRQERYDVIHFAEAGLASWAPFALDVNLRIVTVCGNDLTKPWQDIPVHGRRLRIHEGLSLCSQVVCISEHTASLAGAWGLPQAVLATVPFRSRRISTIRTPRDVTGSSHMNALTVARLAPRKGHEDILRAVERSTQRLSWTIVGSGVNERRLSAKMMSSVASDRMTLQSDVPDRDLRRIYARSHVVVMTPREIRENDTIDSEGFGLVYMEAAQAGRPSIASDSAGCREAVQDGRSGILVRAGDRGALTSVLDELASDRRWRSALGAAAATVFPADVWAQLARDIALVYQRLASRARLVTVGRVGS